MKILITISFILCFVTSFGQNIVRRANGSQTVVDSNLFAGNSFRVAVFQDTTAANTNRPSLDSSGKIIFTYNTNWFWGRQTTPDRKWVPFNNPSTGLNSSCGSANGTHLVTWDSLLTFDVSGGPYVICCDGIPRATNNTSITLDTNSTDFQRIDLIVLDTTGVNWIKGTPALNPSTPNTDSCQIILSYVLINAHDSVPANISATNPFIIYDENYSTEWSNDSSRNVTLDTANTVFPVHLTHSIHVSSFTSGDNEFFLTGASSIDLNSYTLFKFYVKKAIANPQLSIILSWYLDDVQQTLTLQLSPTRTTAYQTFTVALPTFLILNGTSVNRLKMSFAGTSQEFYLDWIQLQNGAIITNAGSTGTVTSVNMNNLDSLLTPSVTNQGSTPTFSFTKFTVPANTVLINNSNIAAQYSWGKIDLSSDLFINTFPTTLIAPGDDGTYLGTNSGVVEWTPFVNDTTFIENWLYRSTDPLSNNDTLRFGSRYPDSSVLAFGTYVSLNGHFFQVDNSDGVGWLFLDATPGTEQSGLQTTNGTGTSKFIANANVGNYSFEAGSTEGAYTMGILGTTTDSSITYSAGKHIFNAIDSIYLNSTLSGASSGYVWTLADPTTGSGYWGVGGGGSPETLQQVFNTEVGGSVLTKSDSIIINTNTLRFIDTTNSGTPSIFISKRGTGNASALTIQGNTQTSGNVTTIQATGGGVGLSITTGFNFGAQINSKQISALTLTVDSNSTTAISPILQLFRTYNSLTPASGSGGSIEYYALSTAVTNRLQNQLISTWTDPTDLTRTSQFSITGVTSSSTETWLTIGQSGYVQFRPMTVTEAGALTPAEGMMLFVSNTDATFTSIGFWGYQNGAWHAF